MDSPIRVLLIEDSDDDAALIVRALRRDFGEFLYRRAKSEADVARELVAFAPHVVLADHNLPLLPRGAALAVSLREAPRTPAIVVTGSLDEETAADYIKAGAADFVVKHHLQRLGPAVRRALELRDAREQQRRAEEERARSERQFKALVEHSTEVVTLLDAAGIILYSSQSITGALGYAPGERVGHSVFTLIHGENQQAARAMFAELRAGASRAVRAEVIAYHRDGSWRNVELVAVNRIDDPDVAAIVVNWRDVTEARRLAAEMEKTQRMEAVGRLAGGVAHDFNNLLTVIQAASEFIISELPPETNAQSDLELILNAAREATALTRQLLAFSRRQVLAPRVLDLNALIPETQKMLARLLGTRVEVQAVLAPDLGRVRADPGQVQQILVNLAVNARDAMPDGGTITIATFNAPDGLVVLRVSDTGIGMDAATQARIFEPFFTTKERARGTGLGLATVYGIAQQSGGTILVESALGKGSSFDVQLPRVDAPVEPRASPELAGRLPRGAETVLIAEDDKTVRALVERILREQGYRVLVAPNGAAALKMAATNVGAIDLLLTDVMMPGLTGHELARALRARHPSVAVLLMSGYVEDGAARADAAESGDRVIEKPFGPPQLVRAVREVLDARNASG